MDERFARAEQAFAQGRMEEARSLLEQAVGDAGEAAPLDAFRRLTGLSILAGRFEAARRWGEAGLARHGEDFDLLNMLGMALRRLQAFDEALACLDRALVLRPGAGAALMNKVAVYNDMKAGAPALEIALPLLEARPDDHELMRLVGLAWRHLDDWRRAEALFDKAIAVRPDAMPAWIDRIALATDLQRHDEALALLDRAIGHFPGARRLLEGRIILLSRAGRGAEAEGYLRGLLAQGESAAWVHHQLGRVLLDTDLTEAAEEFRRAAALEPANPDHPMGVIAALARADATGPGLQQSYDILQEVRGLGPLPQEHTLYAARIYHGIGDYEALQALGSFSDLGRNWVKSGAVGALLRHMGWVRTAEDRRELLEQHKLWGEGAMARAQSEPLTPRAAERRPGKIRLGFLSSDLRGHVVGLFAMPLFDFVDPERFELYGYSFHPGEEDELQRYFASRSKAFHWRRDISDRDAAELIAADDLDMLIDMGGLTALSRPEVFAYRPARLQVSWLGYPHSLGLESIDHIIIDPYLQPDDPALLIERPLLMPHCWLTMGPAQFRDDDVVDLTPPQERNGFVTFGTTNNPIKYSPAMLRTWARVVASVPGSKFAFVRPEAGAPSFQKHMLEHFAAEGVGAERVEFRAIRGRANVIYQGIDISLDTFPLTGGTSTCDSLWMGVPVVSFVGEALFERLSYSLLSNAGLGDLAVRTVDDYVAKATALAADLPRRMALRAALRGMIRSGPLGRHQAFARDFYDLVARAVGRPAPEQTDPRDTPDALRNQARARLSQQDWAGVAAVAARLTALEPTAGDGQRLAAWAALQLALQRLEAGPRTGWQADSEGLALQAVHDATLACVDAGIGGEALPWAVPQVLMRLLARGLLERVGGFEALGRRLAAAGEHRGLLMQQARARATPEDRLELLRQHQLWGAQAEAAAANAPPLPAPRPKGDRIRLGFLSSDLRIHAVGAFAWPLFEHLDPRFEIYVYSVFPGPPDGLQAEIASRIAAYRHMPQTADADVAAAIVADGLDILIDLGGPTGFNRPQLMARRLAPVQMSWLGYAHSVGLRTIDHMLVDRHVVPPDPALLIETPLFLPESWIAMSGAHFRDEPAPAPEPPCVRNGYVTYGSANAGYKYSPLALDLWARTLAAAPGSRFLVVRPEAAAPAFRDNFLAAFAVHGVGPERVRFEPVRGAHLPLYAEMDVSLDPAPLTGGTTTCESLWMGVPVVSLVGEALYERLGLSILTNVGLADLAVRSQEDYVATAVALGKDVQRLRDLRATLRDRVRGGPLGDTERFARDFYDLIAMAVR